MVPQAIFWRPLKYFTLIINEGEDDLDAFEGASFCISNTLDFDLRKYRGHQEFTVTMYLSYKIDNLQEIVEIIENILVGMSIPREAVAWRRGDEFSFGSLKRRPSDRLREIEARVLALKIAALCTEHSASTEYIKKQVPAYIPLSSEDLVQSKSRPNEKRWQQIV